MTDQPATETPNVGPGREGSTFDHPAFGQISASRVTGNPGRTLYGSEFVHRAWINLRISRSSFVLSPSASAAMTPCSALQPPKQRMFCAHLSQNSGVCRFVAPTPPTMSCWT